MTKNKGRLYAKEPTRKKAKGDLSKVKCFNYDMHGDLAKDCSDAP